MTLGNIRITAYDLGGPDTMTKSWKNYFHAVDGIIYLVDAANQARLEESKKELDKVLSQPELVNVPIVILGNKIDMVFLLGWSC